MCGEEDVVIQHIMYKNRERYACGKCCEKIEKAQKTGKT